MSDEQLEFDFSRGTLSPWRLEYPDSNPESITANRYIRSIKNKQNNYVVRIHLNLKDKKRWVIKLFANANGPFDFLTENIKDLADKETAMRIADEKLKKWGFILE